VARTKSSSERATSESPDILGKQTYRVLSYYFSIEWNWGEHIEWLQRVLSPFAVAPDPNEERSPPTPGMPPVYSLIEVQSESSKFQLLYSGGSLIKSRDPSNLLQHLLWHINSEACRRTGDFFLIHAGAVVFPTGGALLLPGPTGSGKTTLVAALVSAGFGYLSDEAAAIDPVTRRVHPFPKALAFKEGSLELLPGLQKAGSNGSVITGQQHLLPEEIRAGSVAAPGQVAAIVAIVRNSETEIAPITAATAAKILAENALNLRAYKSRGLELIADVVRGANCFRMKLGPLDKAVEAITGLAKT
jgi:hypothetical protein